MKLLLVNTLYPPADVGGAERSVEQLARGLAGAGGKVSVVTLSPVSEAGVEVRDGVRVHRLPLRHFYWPYDGRRRPVVHRSMWHGLEAVSRLMDKAVDQVVEAERPDLIHAHVMTGFATSVFRTARKRGLPLVQTLRDYSMLCARAALFRNGRRCAGRCGDCILLTAGRRRAAAAVDHVVGVSRAVVETHRAAGYFRGVRWSVIGNTAGLAPVRFLPSRAQGDPMCFGFIGRLTPEKGIEILLRATMKLPGEWRLRIAGRGDPAYVERLQRTYADQRIAWLGQVEASGFFGAVDVVVAPALWAEPFGRGVAEAVAHGCAVIVSDIGGLSEAAGGACATLVGPGDVEALAGAMAQAAADPEGWRSCAPSSPIWTETTISEAYRDLYVAVLNRSASRASAERSQL